MRTIAVSELDGMYIVWNGTRGKTFESEDITLGKDHGTVVVFTNWSFIILLSSEH